MKSILTFIALLTIIVSRAQDSFNNFKVTESNDLIWQKVYDIDVTTRDMYSYIKSIGSIKGIEMSEGVIYGEISELSLLYKEAGLKWSNTAMYVSRLNTFASFNIDFREGRYRVTVTGVKSAMPNTLEVTRNSISYTDLKDLAFSKGKVKKSFIDKESKAFDYTFNKLFEYKKTDDNW